MRPLLVLAILVLVSGCLQPGTSTPVSSRNSTTAPSAPAAPGELSFGFLGPNVTRAGFLHVYANVTGSLDLRITANGTQVHAGRLVDENRTWNLTLDPGRTSIVAESSQGRRSLEAVSLVRTGLEIDYCHFHPSSPTARKVDRFDVWIDMDSRPSRKEYEAASAKRPDRFNAHDQIRQWSTETRTPIVVAYHASLEGFSLDKVDGVGNPVTAAAPPYWLLYKNGEESPVGMTLLPVRGGDRIAWRLC